MPIPKRPKTISQEIDEFPSWLKFVGWACAIWFVILPASGWLILWIWILLGG